MDTLQAILLGIVQGITEFLPVSSSGHLQIAKELLGVELSDNVTFDVTLHAATVLSTISGHVARDLEAPLGALRALSTTSRPMCSRFFFR